MRTKRLSLGFALVLMIAGLAWAQKEKASGSSKKDDPYAELVQAPEKARNRKNPLEHDPEALAAGRKLFERHCAECHGENAGGTKKAPNLRVAEVQEATQGTLFWVLTNGIVRSGMPVWSKLPEAQRWQIVCYLKSLGPAQPDRREPTSLPR
jgi:mono/diheme cytochrome c family protein